MAPTTIISLNVIVLMALFGGTLASSTGNGTTTGPLPWAEPTAEQEPLWIVSGIAVLIAVLVVLRALIGHNHWWNHPKIQHYEVRCLTLPMVYGLTALISMIFPNTMPTNILIRQAYSAFLVYNWLELLISYFAPHDTVERRREIAGRIMAKLPVIKAKPPCCCCGRLQPGPGFLHDHMVMPIRVFVYGVPFLAIVGEYFAAYNIYEFGSNDTTTAFFYLNLAAVACTMYGLQAVFLGFQVLENVIPDAKLQNVAVHIVLGPLVIQELVISILAANGAIDPMFGLTHVGGTVGQLINLLHCLESPLVAILYSKAFGFARFRAMDDKTHSFVHEDFVELPELSQGRRYSALDEMAAENISRAAVDSMHRASVAAAALAQPAAAAAAASTEEASEAALADAAALDTVDTTAVTVEETPAEAKAEGEE